MQLYFEGQILFSILDFMSFLKGTKTITKGVFVSSGLSLLKDLKGHNNDLDVIFPLQITTCWTINPA